MTTTRMSVPPHLLTLFALIVLALLPCLSTADAFYYPLGRYRRWDYYGGDGGHYGWGGRWWSRDRHRGNWQGNGSGGGGPGGRFVDVGRGDGGGGGGLPSVGVNFPGEGSNNNNAFVGASDPQPTAPVQGDNGIASIDIRGSGGG